MRAYEFLNEGINDPHIFKAVFTAGSPGAGKSTIVQKLFSHSGLKSVDIDRFEAIYRKRGEPTDYDKYRKKADQQRNMYVMGRLGLIIDTPARNIEKITMIKEELENTGYETAMIFVSAPLEVAQHRAKVRGEQTGRKMTDEMVKTYWDEIQNKIEIIQSTFRHRFWLIDNSQPALPNLSKVSSQINSWLNRPLVNPEARKWLSQQSTKR